MMGSDKRTKKNLFVQQTEVAQPDRHFIITMVGHYIPTTERFQGVDPFVRFYTSQKRLCQDLLNKKEENTLLKGKKKKRRNYLLVVFVLVCPENLMIKRLH